MAKIKTINGHRTAVNTRYRLSRNTGLAIIEPDDSYVVMGDEVMDSQTLYSINGKDVAGLSSLRGGDYVPPHNHFLMTTKPSAHTPQASSTGYYQLPVNMFGRGNNGYRCVLDKATRQKAGVMYAFQDTAGVDHLLVQVKENATGVAPTTEIILIEGASVTGAVNKAVMPTPPAHAENTTYLTSSSLDVLYVDVANKTIYFLANFYRPSNASYFYLAKNDLYRASFTTTAVDGSLTFSTPTRCSAINVGGFNGGSTYVESQPRFFCGLNNAGKPCFLTIQENQWALQSLSINSAYQDADPYGGDAGYWRSAFSGQSFRHAMDIYEVGSNTTTRIADLGLTYTNTSSMGSRFGGHRTPTHFEPSPIAGESNIYYAYTLVFNQAGTAINFVRFKWNKALDTFETTLLTGVNLKDYWSDLLAVTTTRALNTCVLTNDGAGGYFLSVFVEHFDQTTLGVHGTESKNIVVFTLDPTDMSTMTLKQSTAFPALRVVGGNENNTTLYSIESGSAKVWTWTTNGWLNTYTTQGNYMGFGEDHNGVLWGVSCNSADMNGTGSTPYAFNTATQQLTLTLEYLSQELPNSVIVEFVDSSITYAGVSLTKNLRVNAYNVAGERIAKNCVVKISSSNAVFTSNNAQVLSVTTSDSEDTLVSLTIDGPGFINVSASFEL